MYSGYSLADWIPILATPVYRDLAYWGCHVALPSRQSKAYFLASVHAVCAVAAVAGARGDNCRLWADLVLSRTEWVAATRAMCIIVAEQYEVMLVAGTILDPVL